MPAPVTRSSSSSSTKKQLSGSLVKHAKEIRVVYSFIKLKIIRITFKIMI